MRQIIAPLVAAAMLAACAQRTDVNEAKAHFDSGRTLTLMECKGGLEREYLAVQMYLARGLKVEYGRTAASACTELLFWKGDNLCYHPETVFAFHGGFNRETGELDTRANIERKLDKYPPKLATVLRKASALDDVNVFTEIRGDKMAALDWQPRLCRE